MILLALEVISALILLAFLVLLIVLPIHWTPQKDADLVNKIPGPSYVPFLGNILQFKAANHLFLSQLVKICLDNGITCRFWARGMAFVFIRDLDDVEVVLSSKRNITKSVNYTRLQPWLGTGLLTSTGEKWQKHRKLLTPTFHFDILKEYMKIFNANSTILVDKLKSHMNAEYVNINHFVTLCTLDIICETAMGTSVNAQNGGQANYVNAVKRMSQLFIYRQMRPYLFRDFIWKLCPAGKEQMNVIKILHQFTIQMIKKKQEEYRSQKNESKIEGKKKRLAFLDLLIEISEKEGLLTDEEIREEVDTFMFEGHDTSSAAICWALFLIGHHPEVQDRIMEELNGIFGSSNREVNYEDLQEMKYLEMVIKEALRLYPSVPIMLRVLDTDIQIKGYKIPAGTSIPIFTYLIHRNPQVFPDPEKFNPDHFLPEKVKLRHPFAYLPFSAGPRNCIGQRFAMFEEKTVISTILRNFKITSLDRREDIIVMAELILRPEPGLNLKLDPRNKIVF